MLSESLLLRATALKLHGVINQVNEIKAEGECWLEQFITWEEAHRSQRSLEGRLRKSKLERFKSMADFDWAWPKHCARDVVEQWLQLVSSRYSRVTQFLSTDRTADYFKITSTKWHQLGLGL